MSESLLDDQLEQRLSRLQDEMTALRNTISKLMKSVNTITPQLEQLNQSILEMLTNQPKQVEGVAQEPAQPPPSQPSPPQQPSFYTFPQPLQLQHRPTAQPQTKSNSELLEMVSQCLPNIEAWTGTPCSGLLFDSADEDFDQDTAVQLFSSESFCMVFITVDNFIGGVFGHAHLGSPSPQVDPTLMMFSLFANDQSQTPQRWTLKDGMKDQPMTWINVDDKRCVLSIGTEGRFEFVASFEPYEMACLSHGIGSCFEGMTDEHLVGKGSRQVGALVKVKRIIFFFELM